MNENSSHRVVGCLFKKIVLLCIPVAKYRRKLRRKWFSRENARVACLEKMCGWGDESEKYKLLMDHFYTSNPNLNSSCYVPRSDRYYDSKTNAVKLLAFYLPQFHTFPENEAWWGRGFTEWTNVTKALPHYEGHYQPHLPDELGFYDLSHTDAMVKQIDMARQYGIYGFCFHYYWFSGKRLMEKPLFNYLEDKTLDFPFCCCWANETWSRRWDGSENEILISQAFNRGDIDRFYKDIRDFFLDERYIKVDNKPVLIIYRTDLFEKQLILDALDRWAQLAHEDNWDGIYAIYAQSFGMKDDPEAWGFDAAVEFPPHNCQVGSGKKVRPLTESFEMDVKDIKENIDYIFEFNPSYTLFRTACPGWDNTARKSGKALSCHGLTPEVYEEWLGRGIEEIMQKQNSDVPFVFINAWNEWAEGAHLEPDRKYGFAYLEATRNALEKRSLIKENVCV